VNIFSVTGEAIDTNLLNYKIKLIVTKSYP